MIIIGRDGYVNGIPCIQSWALNRASTVGRYSASCTDRGTAAHNGNINESGVITGIGGNPAITPGVDFTFKGVTDNTPGAARVYDGTILPTSLDIDCPTEDGTPITWSANFGVQSELTPGAVGAADATFAEHLGATAALPPELSTDGSAWYAIPGFRSWHISLTTPEKTRVSNAKTVRKAGNLEGEITINIYEDEIRNVNFDINTVKQVRLYVDATTYWLFKWIKFSDISGMTVNRGTQDWVAPTLRGIWSDVKGTVLGSIKRPDGTFLFGTV